MPRIAPVHNPLPVVQNAIEGAADPFHSLLRGALAHVEDTQRYARTMRDLEHSGISGLAPNNRGRWWGSDADRLAKVISKRGYAHDPRAQARFLVMLKQLGYLPQQAL